MCTLALYFRVFEEVPLLVAANRDEHYDRLSAAPSLLDGKPKIFAGKDLRAGGTWLGVNDYGLLVGVLNRKASKEQSTKRPFRSRGLLCLDLLKCTTLSDAYEILREQGKIAYQPFTLVFADENAAWAAYNRTAEIVLARLDIGLHVFSNTSEFDSRSEKVDRAYRRFAAFIDMPQRCSDPPTDRVSILAQILGDHTLGNGLTGPNEAICVHGDGFGTVSSSIICYSRSGREFQNFYSTGAPCQSPFMLQGNLAIQ